MPHSCTGITIIKNKTKLLMVGRHVATTTAKPVIVLHGEQLEVVSHFMLEAAFSCNLDAEITHRVIANNSAFQQPRQPDI